MPKPKQSPTTPSAFELGFQPKPLTSSEQKIINKHHWETFIKPSLVAMEKEKNDQDYAFATADQEAQQLVGATLTPFRTAYSVADTALRLGTTAYGVTHAKQLGTLLKLHPALAALGTTSLLFGQPLYNALRQYDYQVRAWQDPSYIVEHKVTQKIKNTLLRGTLPVLSQPLVALGYSLGLLDTAEVPHQLDPINVTVHSPIFKPTKWAHQIPASGLEWLANKRTKKLTKKGIKSSQDAIVGGLRYQAELLKYHRRRRSFLGWLLYPFALLTGTAAEILFFYLHNKLPGLASFLRGYAGSMLRAIPSLNTALSVWGGYTMGGPVVASISGAAGWGYQTLISLANNFQTARLDIFQNNYIGSQQLRLHLMPLEYETIFGPNYHNNPAAIKHYMRHNTYQIPGTQWRGKPGTAQAQLLNLRYLRPNSFFGKTVRFLFHNKWTQCLPLRGFMLGRILNLPFFSKENLILMAGDFTLQLFSRYPVLKQIRNSALLGMAVGAEIALLTGQNIGTFAATGAALGTTVQLANLLANTEVTAFYATPTSAPRFVGHLQLYRNGLRVTSIKHTPATANFWELTNKGDYLAFRFPGLNRTKLFNRLFAKFNQAGGGWVQHLRYLRGAWTGALIGAQLYLLTGDPKFIAFGAGAGAGAQILWDRFLARLTAKASRAFSNILREFSKKVLGPISAAINIYGAMASISSFISNPNWGTLASTALTVGLGTSTLVLLGVAPPIALAIMAGTVVLQAIVQVLTGFSIADWIAKNILAPIGRLFMHLVGPLLGFLGQIGTAALGFFLGIVEGITAIDLKSQAAGFATAAFSIATMGTGLLSFLVGSSFFTQTPAQMQQLAHGLLGFTTEKQSIDLIYDGNDQVIGIKYLLSYNYPQALKDASGNSIASPAIDITITDQFISPIGLSKNDLAVTSYIPSNLSSPTLRTSPIRIVFSNILPAGLSPGNSGTIQLEIQLSKPLPELLSEYKASALCNRLVFNAEVENIDVESLSSPTCLDQSGSVTLPPPDLLAANLATFLRQCYIQYQGTCNDPVSKNDFIARQITDPDESPPSSCTDPVVIRACEMIYMPIYNIDNQILSIIEADVLDPDNPNGLLRSAAFVKAVQAMQGRDFPIYQDFNHYRQTCVAGHYTFTSDGSSCQLGDIAIFRLGSVDTLGIIVQKQAEGNQSFSITQISLNGVPHTSTTPLLPADFGCLQYTPQQCP